MTYVKLDDGFFRNPKVVGIGAEARLLYLAGLCYCSATLTDGVIAAGAVRVLAAECEVEDRAGAVARLVDAGLWVDAGGSYHVHDYLKHNRSKAEIEELSAKRAEVGRLGGRPRKQTESKPKANSLANGKQTESKKNPDTDTDTDTDTVKGVTPPNPPSAVPRPPNAPWTLLETLCDELGQDATTLSKPSRDKQLGVAKRLTASGLTEGDLRAMVRWLLPQPWVNASVDLNLIEKQRSKWELAGKPDSAPALRHVPAARGSPGKDMGYSTKELIEMGRRGGPG